MLRRAVTLPVDTGSVWRAITDPDAMERWFGSSVEWDLRPGGRARFRQADGGDRDGVIDDVEPERRLRFRWWPADGAGDVSEVAYELEPRDGGTDLTVTERRVASTPGASETGPTASTASPTASAATGGAGVWSDVDQAAWDAWAGPGVRLHAGPAARWDGRAARVRCSDPDQAGAAHWAGAADLVVCCSR